MTKPLPYQLEGVDFIDEHGGRALVADDMGLGKTFQSLLWADDNRSVRPIIVVCPANVKYHWQKEASMHFGIRAEILFGRKPPKQRQALFRHPMLIINYEILKYWLPFLKRYGALLLIIDEIHRIKNVDAQCSVAVRELSYGIPHIIELGGTPMENKPSELFHPLHILDPKKFKNYLRFAFRFCKVKRTPWGWDFRKPKRPKALNRLLKRYMIRRLKVDVRKDMAVKTRIVIPVEMSNKREYEAAVKDFRRWLDKKAPRSAGKLKRKSWKAEQLVKLGYLKRLTADLKLKAVFEWIDNFLEETDQKLVVFGIHKKIISAIEERYKGISVKLTGSTSSKHRKQAVEKFVADKHIRLFLGNLHAAGVGVNGLQHASSTVLTVELDWKPTTHEQADARVDRMGQKLPVTSFMLVAKDSMEEKLCAVLQEKQEDTSEILDGKKRTSSSTMDVFDQLTLAVSGRRRLF